MWLQFFLENLHFALNLFEALVFFAVFWLYFDAWSERKTFREVFKICGFLLLSASFVVHATFIESSVLSSQLIGGDFYNLLFSICRILGYLFVIIGLILEPLQLRPAVQKAARAAVFILPPVILEKAGYLPAAFPVLAVIVSFLYLRRATLGLENHLKKVTLSFFILSLSELLSLGYLLQSSNNVEIFNFVVPFGWLWIIQHLTEFIAVLILQRWVFGYLFKRLQTQLFMIFTSLVLGIFLLTTVTFTGLLLKNLQDETLKKLETDVKVLNFAIESRKAENLSDAQVVAQNPQIITALEDKAQGQLNDVTRDFLLTKRESSLIIVDGDGKVVARGEDRERVGDSLSNDQMIKAALVDRAPSSVSLKDGALAKTVSVKSAVAVKAEGKTVGAVMTGIDIDNAFVDGIREATGLETSIYGGNLLSATTLLGQDGRSRPIGIKEEDSGVKTRVLSDGSNYTGAVNILNTPYFAAYMPLKDVDNNPVGMLFVGRKQIGILQTAARSIELTFQATVILLVLSIFPSYMIAKYLTGQIH